MNNKKLLLIVKIMIFGILIFLFSYLRLRPIYTQTVGYTYDQGRDFIQAAEMVINKNPVFIGPTTGIAGVFHGAWWYYYLAIPFIFTHGLPVGYYYFNFITQCITFLVFIFFTKKYFGFLTSAILSFILATSWQFIISTIFMANNVMAVPFVFYLAFSSLLLLKGQSKISIPKTTVSIPLLLITGLSLGFISEFEFAFGLLLIPTYLLLITAFHFQKKIFLSIKDVFIFLTGLAIPFLPRLLFELKNSFPQVKVLFNFVVHPAYHTPKPYFQVYQDRVQLFHGYFNSLFLNDAVRYVLLSAIIIFIALRIYKKEFSMQRSLIFIALLVFGLFGVSILYRDTFWSYYYEGIQFLFIFIFGFLISFYSEKKSAYFTYTKVALLTLLLAIGIQFVIKDIQKNAQVYDGIQVQQDIVAYIQSHIKPNEEYCVKVYTPPVIPHTYNYLFLYQQVAHKIPKPTDGWVNNQCWYILEFDDYKERKDQWIKNNIPETSETVTKKTIKDVTIVLQRGKN